MEAPTPWSTITSLDGAQHTLVHNKGLLDKWKEVKGQTRPLVPSDLPSLDSSGICISQRRGWGVRVHKATQGCCT